VTDGRDAFFNNLFSEGAEQTTNFQRHQSFENRAVKRVLSECGVKVRSMGQLVNMCKDATGHHEFTFSWFSDTFPAFPAQLGGKKITYVGKQVCESTGKKTNKYLYQIDVLDIFRQNYNKIVLALSRAMQQQQIDRSRPFIFLFPVVKTMLCAHNLDVPPVFNKEKPHIQLRFSWENGTTLYIERSADLFAALGPEWYEI
jgi:hypothetical protein